MSQPGNKDKTKDAILKCPVGNRECDLPDEIGKCRAEIKRLSRLVATDPLTGLRNYRYFSETVERELERTRRTALPSSLIMMDIDYFKQINDRFGHEAGNEALCFVASLLVKFTRQLDTPCRYGGEEFAIILPGTGLQRAINTAERLREKLASTPLRLDGEDIFITASFGVDVFHNSDNCSPGEFIDKVDRHLLRAKASGRNRVCAGKPEARVDTRITGKEKAALYNFSTPDEQGLSENE
jgi:diguanylate cyclase (GGDEF)-like protein